MSGEIVSPYPPSLVEAVLASKLCKDKMDNRGAAGLFAVLEVLPYNTPVTRFGCTYHLIRDAHGGVFLTQGGDHEWGKDSFMRCGCGCGCGKTGESRDFEVPDDYLEMRRFIEKLARMNYDGEEGAGEGGDDFDMSGDDAAETLSLAIREAREIIENN